MFPAPAERDSVLARLEQTGHDIVASDAGPTVRDPSGNTLALVSVGSSQR